MKGDILSNSLLPRNSTHIERELEYQSIRIDALPTPIREPFNPRDCPPELLDMLAGAWSVDYWDNGFSTQKKRDVLNASFAIHQIKGTPESIRHAIRSAGFGEVTIVERWAMQKYNGVYKYDGKIQYTDGTGHWAKYAVIMQFQITAAQARNIRNILNSVAPARCELVSLTYRESIKYDGKHKYDGTYSFGAD